MANSLFLTRRQVEKLTGLPIKFISRHITPIDLGKGRGNGLRWSYEEVMTLCVTLLHKTPGKTRVNADLHLEMHRS